MPIEMAIYEGLSEPKVGLPYGPKDPLLFGMDATGLDLALAGPFDTYGMHGQTIHHTS